MKTIVGILILVIGVGYYFYAVPPTSAPEQIVEISYTDAGYVPSEVAIKRGGTVRWVNNSSAEMWPASAVHPTHSVYPEKDESNCLGSSFDSCRRLLSDESYEFTFNEVGSWKFHDHVRPSKTGVVHVTE